MTTNNALNIPLSGSTGSGLVTGATAPTMSNVTVDNINIHTNTISSTNSNGDIDLIPNGTGAVLMGTSSQMFAPGSAFTAQIASGGKQSVLATGSYINSSGGPVYDLIKSRSTTVGSFTTVTNADSLGIISFLDDDGTQLKVATQIQSTVSGSVSTGIVPSQLIINTTNTSGALTTAVTISNAQVVTLANALPVASGGTGITAFGTGVATALGANVVGSGGISLETDSTFTPAIAFGGGTTGITYTTQTGSYTRIGNIITFSIEIVLSSKGSSSGTSTITGLPVALKAGSAKAVFFATLEGVTYTGTTGASMAAAGTTLTFYSIASAGSSQVIADTAWTNTSKVYITGSYLV